MAKKDLIKRADGSYSPRGLWDNIRANAGSGKKPTKEMLAQEKKINKMAHGGKMSSFKASNIQTYPQGGAMGGPGLPLNMKHGIENGSFLINPFYTNSPTGAFIPQTSIGFGTAPQHPEKGGWSITGRVGREYPSLNALTQPIRDAYQVDQEHVDPSYYNPDNIPELQSWAQETADKDNKNVDFYNKVEQKLMPGALKNVSYGLNATYKGKVGLDGQRFIPEAGIRADYSQSGGLGISGTAGANFQFGKPNYRQGQLRDGYAAGIVGPYYSAGINALTGPSMNYGLKGEMDYRPKFFGNMPGMLYAKGSAQFNAAGGGGSKIFTVMPQFSGEIGYKLPADKAKQIDLPKIPMPDMSPITSFLGRASKGNEEELLMQGGDPYGDFGPRVNASPIDKRWNKNAEDIYIRSTQSGPNAEPIIYNPNDPEGLGENNFKQGGAMNFKSPAAYKAWLAYGHATGEFERTPGNQKVSIGGKAHNVKHAMGGHMYSMGGRAFADGGQLTEFTEGGSHEMNPLGGIPQGFAQDGKLNLVEQGETKLNAADYVFSDQIKVSKEAATLFELPKNAIGKTYADLSKKLNRPDSRRENDTIEQVAIQRDLENLMQAQEQQKDMEKQDAIAEMQAKYPDLQVVDQAAMQEMQAPQGGQMQDPAMMDEAMMQQQQQMAPPAEMPQEMDPAMMQQMQQQGIMSHGGKMYNMGGHMYSAGGGMMALRGIGSAAYGVGEGILDTLTFGLTDNLTNKGGEFISQMGNVDDRQAGRLDAVRGFGNTAGAITGAAVTGGAATNSAISEGVEGLASGVAALPSTGEQVDKVAQGVGQLGSMYGQFFGGSPGKAVPEGALEGSKAASALMNAPQNKFITQAMNVAGNVMAQGGYLGESTNNMFTNQLAAGSFLDTEPKAIFNINGTPVTMTLSEALEDPTIIEMFASDQVQRDEDGDIIPEDQMDARQAAREAIIAHFNTAAIDERMATMPTLTPDEVISTNDSLDFIDTIPKLAGETEDEYQSRMAKLRTNLDQKGTLEEIKANPILASAMALPALYNIGRGIFGKVDKLDAKDYLSKAKISPYEMNVDPQVAAAQRAYATSIQAAKNAAPGAGSYLATLGNMANMRQQAVRDIYAQKENFDKSQKMEADKFNAQVEAQNMSQDLAIQQYNAQAKAAKEALLSTGLGQLATAAEGLTSQDLQEKYLQTISPDFAKNFNYVSILEQMARAKAKSKKS